MTDYIRLLDTDTKLNDKQKKIIYESFSELHPYIKNYRLEYHGCPKTNLNHVSVVFDFEENKHIDLSILSEDFKIIWRLNNLQEIFNKPSGKLWRDGCIMRMGVPPISRTLPKNIIESVFLRPEIFHFEGNYDCFG